MVKIKFEFPPELSKNMTIRQAIISSANMVRDMWLAISPYATGSYAEGLLKQNSIKIGVGYFEVINHSPHAWPIEKGFNTYNWGLRTLLKGKRVKYAKDGSRYKIIKIEPSPTSRYRKPSAGQRVINSFTKMMPMGMSTKRITKYGGLKPYSSRKSLQKPLKGGPARSMSPKGFYVVSEKAIQKNPMKWQMPSREGKYLAERVKRDAAPLVKEAIRKVVLKEKERQERMGKTPSWYQPSFARNPVKQVPIGRVR